MSPAEFERIRPYGCFWQTAKGALVMAGPDHDLKALYPGAKPLFDSAHRDRVRALSKPQEKAA